MKELDLTNSTVLKWLLKYGGGYDRWDIRDCSNICTLLRMGVYSLGRGAVTLFSLIATILFMIALFCGTVWCLGVMFSFLTLYLPDGWQASPRTILSGSLALGITCLIAIAGGVVETIHGNMKFAPEYMKRPLRKLFRKGNTGVNNTPTKVKEPSPTMVAIKEMYLSFKNKTCIKVKL